MDKCPNCNEELEVLTTKKGEEIYYCSRCKKAFFKEWEQDNQNTSVNNQNNTAIISAVPQTIQTRTLSDAEELKECLEDIIIAVDESPNYDKEFYNLLLAITKKMKSHYNGLSITERSNISLYYDALTMTVDNLKSFYSMGSMGAMSINSMVPTIKSHATNAYAKMC